MRCGTRETRRLARPYENGAVEIDGALPSGQESQKSASAALRINREDAGATKGDGKSKMPR
jgi:hypothetical protein